MSNKLFNILLSLVLFVTVQDASSAPRKKSPRVSTSSGSFFKGAAGSLAECNSQLAVPADEFCGKLNSFHSKTVVEPSGLVAWFNTLDTTPAPERLEVMSTDGNVFVRNRRPGEQVAIDGSGNPLFSLSCGNPARKPEQKAEAAEYSYEPPQRQVEVPRPKCTVVQGAPYTGGSGYYQGQQAAVTYQQPYTNGVACYYPPPAYAVQQQYPAVYQQSAGYQQQPSVYRGSTNLSFSYVGGTSYRSNVYAPTTSYSNQQSWYNNQAWTNSGNRNTYNYPPGTTTLPPGTGQNGDPGTLPPVNTNPPGTGINANPGYTPSTGGGGIMDPSIRFRPGFGNNANPGGGGFVANTGSMPVGVGYNGVTGNSGGAFGFLTGGTGMNASPGKW